MWANEALSRPAAFSLKCSTWILRTCSRASAFGFICQKDRRHLGHDEAGATCAHRQARKTVRTPIVPVFLSWILPETRNTVLCGSAQHTPPLTLVAAVTMTKVGVSAYLQRQEAGGRRTERGCASLPRIRAKAPGVSTSCPSWRRVRGCVAAPVSSSAPAARCPVCAAPPRLCPVTLLSDDLCALRAITAAAPLVVPSLVSITSCCSLQLYVCPRCRLPLGSVQSSQ